MTSVYNLLEVAKHNTATDCWIVVHGKVYNVTRFLEEHPGGDEVILSATGKDATADFEDMGHSQMARNMMSKFEVGKIEASSIPTKFKAVDRANEPKYNPDKSGEFIMKILQILIPLAILAFAVASRFLTVQEVALEP